MNVLDLYKPLAAWGGEDRSRFVYIFKGDYDEVFVFLGDCVDCVVVLLFSALCFLLLW